MKHLRMISQRFIKLSLSLVMFASMSANAAPIINGSLGLTSSFPDIQSNNLTFDYTASNGAFDISSPFGSSAGLLLDATSAQQSIANSNFSISGTADALSANLSLLVTGDLDGNGVVTLIAGTLTAMSNSGAGSFEFIFGGLSGSLQSLYGTEAGVIFTDPSLTQFNFSDFTTSYSGLSDTFGIKSVSVSAPATFSLSLLGFTLLMMARRSKSRQA